MTIKRAWPDVAIPPGETLAEELAARNLSQKALALKMRRPVQVVNEIVLGKRGISADTALRLARFFGTSEQLWLNLQSRHDLESERDRLGSRLRREVRVFAQPR